jgi:hypothetical protein
MSNYVLWWWWSSWISDWHQNHKFGRDLTWYHLFDVLVWDDLTEEAVCLYFP